MNIIGGNILDIKEGIICHQVNCKGVACAGLAKQIRLKWPEWYLDYLVKCKMWKNNGLLGNISLFKIDNDLSVVNLFSQFSYGRDKQHTDYKAFRLCLEAVSARYGDKQVCPMA